MRKEPSSAFFMLGFVTLAIGGLLVVATAIWFFSTGHHS